jgi:lipopolysaccharide export system protein LptC
MTAQADLIRDKRRHFAAPGGFHDWLVGFLGKVLPAGIGLIAAVMILVPLSPRGEISFLLDRNKVAVTPERIHVDAAMYRGADDQGRPFRLTAGSAIQPTPARPILDLKDLAGQMQLKDGPAKLDAAAGTYNFDTSQVDVPGPVDFSASDGYTMIVQNVGINLRTRQMAGGGGVSGTVPAGTFAAERISGDLNQRTVTLEGNARLRMTPGKMRMPQ